jgi:glycosyltransferase involved in cell wall biosynthesis
MVLVLPSLRVSGGVLEALRLGERMVLAGYAVQVLSLWKAEITAATSLPTASLSAWPPVAKNAAQQFPRLAFRYWASLRAARQAKTPSTHHVFSHYSTLPLALLVPKQRRWWFVQDIEWEFPSRSWVRAWLRVLILFVARRSRLVVANSYLHQAMLKEGLTVEMTYPIWADASFATHEHHPMATRPIDVLFVLRSGRMKRPTLYFQVMQALQRLMPTLRVTAVSPDRSWLQACEAAVTGVSLVHNPSRDALKQLYQTSKCFLLLSEHEGFGLPPLEAMGSGCVPVCCDSGGPRAYMTGTLSQLLMPLSWTAEAMARRLADVLADPEQWATLSSLARQTFDHGQHITEQQRASVLQTLGAALAEAPR